MSEGSALHKALDAGEAAWAPIVDEWSPGYCRSAATPLMDQNQAFVEGFIAGRTIAAEQIEAATSEFALQTKVPYGRMPSHHRYYWRQITVEAFRAAGLLIEGQDND